MRERISHPKHSVEHIEPKILWHHGTCDCCGKKARIDLSFLGTIRSTARAIASVRIASITISRYCVRQRTVPRERRGAMTNQIMTLSEMQYNLYGWHYSR